MIQRLYNSSDRNSWEKNECQILFREWGPLLCGKWLYKRMKECQLCTLSYILYSFHLLWNRRACHCLLSRTLLFCRNSHLFLDNLSNVILHLLHVLWGLSSAYPPLILWFLVWWRSHWLCNLWWKTTEHPIFFFPIFVHCLLTSKLLTL